MRTQAEHLKWCKQRAREAYDFYKPSDPEAARHTAIASMLSDLGKHAETAILQRTAFVISLSVVDEPSLFEFIDGWKEEGRKSMKTVDPNEWVNTWPGNWNLYKGSRMNPTNVASIEGLTMGPCRWLLREDPRAIWHEAGSLELAKKAVGAALAALRKREERRVEP